MNIGFRHVFSAELDDTKRAYLLEAFEDAEHVFSDVACFAKRIGFCYRCGGEHALDSSLNVDLPAVGPSCKDISSLASESPWYIYIYMIGIDRWWTSYLEHLSPGSPGLYHKFRMVPISIYIYMHLYIYIYAYIYIYDGNYSHQPARWGSPYLDYRRGCWHTSMRLLRQAKP